MSLSGLICPVIHFQHYTDVHVYRCHGTVMQQHWLNSSTFLATILIGTALVAALVPGLSACCSAIVLQVPASPCIDLIHSTLKCELGTTMLCMSMPASAASLMMSASPKNPGPALTSCSLRDHSTHKPTANLYHLVAILNTCLLLQTLPLGHSMKSATAGRAVMLPLPC